MCVPKDIPIEDFGSRILNADYESFFQYVHRSLTRKIVIFKNEGNLKENSRIN
jgi:hypothetical protein